MRSFIALLLLLLSFGTTACVTEDEPLTDEEILELTDIDVIEERDQAATLADPVTWGEFASGDIAANPLYNDPNANFANPLYAE